MGPDEDLPYAVREQTAEIRSAKMQTFGTGATRNDDKAKFDFEGFLHPEALHAYGEYMHSHRKQRDGSIRDSDNWQKGIPFRKYAKSLVRHVFDLWRMERGFSAINPDTGQQHTKQELCCAIVFNALGYLKELVDPAEINIVDAQPVKAGPEPGAASDSGCGCEICVSNRSRSFNQSRTGMKL